jgi:hypothetical protein
VSHRPRVLGAIVAGSVVLRVAVAALLGNGIDPLPGVADQLSYHSLALRVLEGHGFSFATGWWPVTAPNAPTAHWSFAYVLYLAAVYGITGPLPLAARLLQAVIVGVAQPWLAWRIGRRLFGEDTGIASAALAAFYGYFVFYGGALVTESFFIAACLWVVDVATRLAYAARDGEPSRASAWALLGVSIAVATLLRQAFLVLVPVVVLWAAWHEVAAGAHGRSRARAALRAAARVGVAALVVAAFVLPWTARNYRAFDRFVLLNTNAGYVFFYGAHPMHGTQFVPILSGGSDAYEALLPPGVLKMRLDEAGLERHLLERGLGYVAADPVRYARVSLSRAREFFKFWPSGDSGLASNLVRVGSFGLLLPLLLAGLAIVSAGRRSEYRHGAPGAFLLVCLAAVYTVVHLLTWTLVRYRLPIDAISMPIAGVAVVTLVAWLRGLVPDAGRRAEGPADRLPAR